MTSRGKRKPGDFLPFRGCSKAYHPSSGDRDDAFFGSSCKSNSGSHMCSKCEKTATYMCYTCAFSLCKGCAKDAAFFCIRGNMGLCETCIESVMAIERKEPLQLDFDNKTSWEYQFKRDWIDLKTQLSLSPEEIDLATKGHDSRASKQGKANENDYRKSDSDSSPKRRKTRSRSNSGSAEKILSPAKKSWSGETIEWASRELLDVVAHMRGGDKSFLTQEEVHLLLLDYIDRYSLRHPRHKTKVICDIRLQNLFGKSYVGHFEMLNLLETHFLQTEQQQGDDIQEKHQRPQSSSFNRRRKGGFSSNESRTDTSNYSNTSGNRELSGSCSGTGSASRGDHWTEPSVPPTGQDRPGYGQPPGFDNRRHGRRGAGGRSVGGGGRSWIRNRRAEGKPVKMYLDIENLKPIGPYDQLVHNVDIALKTYNETYYLEEIIICGRGDLMGSPMTIGKCTVSFYPIPKKVVDCDECGYFIIPKTFDRVDGKPASKFVRVKENADRMLIERFLSYTLNLRNAVILVAASDSDFGGAMLDLVRDNYTVLSAAESAELYVSKPYVSTAAWTWEDLKSGGPCYRRG